jgi:hypothetical protein
MTTARIWAVLAAAAVAALAGARPGAVLAQQFPPPPTGPTVQERWPDPPRPPSQRGPAANPRQSQAAPQSGQAEPLQAAPAKPRAAPKPAVARTPPNVVACNGVFAKDTTHLKLAIKYDSRNVVFGQVDGPDGSKIPGSILFPNDPKRRLEVLWNNEGARADVQVIAINGKSQWSAPKGIRLGLGVAALEKLNGRPFKLSGFGADGATSVLGWEGGALATLPGGCKVGVRLFEDRKSPEDARKAVAGDKELMSNDPGMRTVKAAVGEILIGY